MATKIDNTITAVEAAILKVYARTNRGPGAISCTAAAGWVASPGGGNVSAITLTVQDKDGNDDTETLLFSADELIGRHLLQSGVARRITDNGDTAANVTALVTEDWSTAPSNASAEIRDGFVKCEDDVLLLDDVQDRHFQVVVFPPERDGSFGIENTGRYELPFEVHVVYEYGFDRRRDQQRADEDAQAIINILFDDDNQPTGGVVIIEAGAPEIIEVEIEGDAGGEAAAFVLVTSYVASYTAQSVEE